MRRFGAVPKVLAAAVAAGLSVSACLYGFAGGGFPSHIRTVAVMPFDNRTVDPALTQQVADAVRTAMQNRLGLRPAAESQADALVTGTISQYESDLPLAFQQQETGNVAVTRRLVRITVSVEIYDQQQGLVLWEQSGLRVEGEYQPPQEQDGRDVALDQLVSAIVDGAQSQW